MPAQVFGAEAAVAILNRAFSNTSLSNSLFTNQVSNAKATLPAGADASNAASYAGFAVNFGQAFAGKTPAELSTLILGNLGVLPDAALEAEGAAYISSVGTQYIGVIALQLGIALSKLEGNATYGAKATAWNTEVTQAYTYSSNTANTSNFTGDQSVTVGQTFTLTTGVDTVSGSAGDDTIVGDHNTMTSTDTINGGAGTDTLTFTDSSTSGANTNPIVSGVEIINIRNVNGSAAVAATKETVTLSFNDYTHAANSTITVGGTALALTANMTGAQIAAAFGAGSLPAGYEFVSLNGSQLVLRATNAGTLADITTSQTLGAGSAMTAPTFSIVQGAAAIASAGIVDSFTATNFAGATNLNSFNSTQGVTFNAVAATQSIGKIGGSGDVTANFGATAASGTFNISGGSTGGAITQTGAAIASNTINSTGASANTVGVVTLSGTTNKTLVINADAALTATNIDGLTAGATITVSGAATSATTGVGVTLGTLDADVIALNAGGLTAGGVSATLNASTTIAVTGGAGNDRITTGAVLTTGSVAAGAGTADRLTLAADAHVATLALGNKYSGFEVVQLAAGATQDLSLLATNNTLTGLRLGGSATVTGINSATAGDVTVLANSTASLGVIGALNPGQIDTVTLKVTDEAAAVSTITLTSPTLAGVEILNIAATDNATVTSLANALALTNVNISGAANTSVTTTGIALQTNFNVNAGTATGNVTFDATGATTNGFAFTGGAGTNTVTGGNQVFTANLAASAAKADVVTVTNATGGTTSLANATITGFTNSATVAVGDKLDVIGVAVVQADVAAGTATGITNLTGTVVNGILTFGGTAAATATLQNKIDAAASTNFAGAVNEVIAFEHNGSTYVVSQQAAANTFDAGADLLVQLVGLTGVTALSATASGATTVWVA